MSWRHNYYSDIYIFPHILDKYNYTCNVNTIDVSIDNNGIKRSDVGIKVSIPRVI